MAKREIYENQLGRRLEIRLAVVQPEFYLEVFGEKVQKLLE